MTTKIVHQKKANPIEIAKALKRGKIIVFCPDTIYGFSAIATDNIACEKIAELKHRDNKPMLCLVGKNFNLSNYVSNLSFQTKKIIDKFWPGPLTIILNKKDVFADIVTCGAKTIALRCPQDDWCQTLLKEVNCPIVSTSVNLSGEPFLTSVNEIETKFGRDIDCIIEKDGCLNQQSTIIDCTQEVPKIIRTGAISEKDLLKFLK